MVALLNRISDANDTLNIEIRAEGHTDDKPIPMNSSLEIIGSLAQLVL